MFRILITGKSYRQPVAKNMCRSMYFPPVRPYQLQRFIHQKLHPNPTKMLKHLQCEAHRSRSAVEVPKPFCGGIEALPSLNCHLVHGLEKSLVQSADFPHNQIEIRHFVQQLRQLPPRPPPKSAHTALAVKACLLGGNSYTKCSITFVNIAVAISALAGGGAKTVSHRDQNSVVFSTFFEDFWVSERKRVLKWNFRSFW